MRTVGNGLGNTSPGVLPSSARTTPLDLQAPSRSPRAPSADHLFPVKYLANLDPRMAAQIASDPAGLRPAHVGCNAARGAGRRRRPHTSRSW